jgi:DNA-binding transcriptional MerR regulator
VQQRELRWRTRIRALLQKGMGLAQIAEKLNEKRVPRPHGYAKWTAAIVREAFVS